MYEEKTWRTHMHLRCIILENSVSSALKRWKKVVQQCGRVKKSWLVNGFFRVRNDDSKLRRRDANHFCSVEKLSGLVQDGEFAWDERMQSLVTGAYYWGYLVTQLPGGRLAEIFGPKHIVAVSLMASALVTFCLPSLARAGVLYLIAGRIVLGITQVGPQGKSTSLPPRCLARSFSGLHTHWLIVPS